MLAVLLILHQMQSLYCDYFCLVVYYLIVNLHSLDLIILEHLMSNVFIESIRVLLDKFEQFPVCSVG